MALDVFSGVGTTLRYAVFDLDGTLLGPRGRLLDGVPAGVAAIRRRGLLPILVTGRSLVGLRALRTIDELLALCDDQILLHNGDVRFDRVTGAVRHRRTLPAEAVRRLRAAGMADLVVEHDGELLASSRRAALAFALAYELPRRTVRLLPPDAPALPATRITLLGGWPAPAPTGANPATRPAGDAAPAGGAATAGDAAAVAAALSGLDCAVYPVEAFRAVVVHPADTCKARALTAHLRARFGETGLDRVLAFGDGDNDARLLAECRVGVAVPDSRPAAVAAAALHLRQPLADFLAHLDPGELLRSVASAAAEAPGADR